MEFQKLYNLIKEDFDVSDEKIDDILNVLKNHLSDKIIFSDGPVISKKTKYNQPENISIFTKPKGLWYAEGDA